MSVLDTEQKLPRMIVQLRWDETSGVDHAANLTEGWEVMKTASLQKVKWSSAEINDLPDSAFAVIEDGGKKDSDGKTVPRGLRALPHHGPDGKVDLPHLRNALARVDGSDLSDEDKATAQKHLDKHAKDAGVGDAGEGKPMKKYGEEMEPEVCMDDALEDLVDDLNWILDEDQTGKAPPANIKSAAQSVVDYVRDCIEADTIVKDADKVVKGSDDEAWAAMKVVVDYLGKAKGDDEEPKGKKPFPGAAPPFKKKDEVKKTDTDDPKDKTLLAAVNYEIAQDDQPANVKAALATVKGFLAKEPANKAVADDKGDVPPQFQKKPKGKGKKAEDDGEEENADGTPKTKTTMKKSIIARAMTALLGAFAAEPEEAPWGSDTLNVAKAETLWKTKYSAVYAAIKADPDLTPEQKLAAINKTVEAMQAETEAE
jgi:hypothetical protein